MKRPLSILLFLGSSACIPTPRDPGHAESSTDGGTMMEPGTEGADESGSGDSDDTTDAPMGPGLDWSLQLEHDGPIVPMLASPDGVVLVTQTDPLAPFATVAEYSSAMELLWSIDLPGASVSALTALPDGGYLVGGSQGPDATAWRLSCCGALDATQSFPVDGYGGIVVAQPQASGFLLARSALDAQTTFIRTDLDLVQEWAVEGPQSWISHGSLTPSGEVVVAAYDDDGTNTLYEVADDGSVTATPLDEPSILVGSGPDLTRVTWGHETLSIQSFAGGPTTSIHAPGLEQDHQVTRGDRFASSWANSRESTATILEFDDAGQVIRRDSLPALHRPHLATTAVAYGTDGAIYVATGESAPDQTYVPMLYRLLPAP